MIVISRRVWALPGEDWETWCVEWSSNQGGPHRELFDNFRDALDFFVDKARALKHPEAADA